MLRDRVAQEAALLLYTGQEKEYKQAKQRASETLGARILPSNIEVAEELDIICEETEGPARKTMILRKRQEAHMIMLVLKMFSPRLIGSVWRGTARQNSDIDILTFSEDHNQVLSQLKEQRFTIKSSEWRSVTKEGRKESSFHIHVALSSGDEAEIAVRDPEKMGQQEKCETYGDIKTGLNFGQLTKVLDENPLQRFLPQ
jgi:predicted nucleotidyltransferase